MPRISKKKKKKKTTKKQSFFHTAAPVLGPLPTHIHLGHLRLLLHSVRHVGARKGGRCLRRLRSQQQENTKNTHNKTLVLSLIQIVTGISLEWFPKENWSRHILVTVSTNVPTIRKRHEKYVWLCGTTQQTLPFLPGEWAGQSRGAAWGGCWDLSWEGLGGGGGG